MKVIDTVFAGPYRMRLIERPAPLSPELLAPRYYIDVKHEHGAHTGIRYLDHDEGCARLLFRRRTDIILNHIRTLDHAGQ